MHWWPAPSVHKQQGLRLARGLTQTDTAWRETSIMLHTTTIRNEVHSCGDTPYLTPREYPLLGIDQIFGSENSSFVLHRKDPLYKS